MAYATTQDLIDSFSEEELTQLTDRDNNGAWDADVVDAALVAADEEINSYIGSRYTLPLASVPGPLRRRACDIARYFLYKDRPTGTVKDNYDAAMAWLRQVRAGDADLGLDENAEVVESVGVDLPETNGAGRTFDDGSLKGF